MTHHLRLGLLLLCLASGGVLAQAPPTNEGPSNPDKVQVSPQPPSGPGTVGMPDGTIYKGEAGGVSGWLTFMAADSSAVLLATGPASLRQQADLLAPLLKRLLEDHPDLRRLSFFLIDRQEIVDRVASALADCRKWNGESGKPVRRDIRRVIVDTINDRDLVAEIADVFAAEGYRLRAQGAAMITETRSAAFGGKLVPSDIAYLAFVADRGSQREDRQSWRTRRSRHSTC